MSRDNKAMTGYDTSNPGMLAVLDGEALWSASAGASGNPAPIATATPGQHEGRRGALSGVQ